MLRVGLQLLAVWPGWQVEEGVVGGLVWLGRVEEDLVEGSGLAALYWSEDWVFVQAF